MNDAESFVACRRTLGQPVGAGLNAVDPSPSELCATSGRVERSKPANEFTRVESECTRDPQEVVERNVDLATFKLPNVGAVKACEVSKPFLRHSATVRTI
jgi:hypothetical protein